MLIADKLYANYLEPGEKIIAICHRHPFILIPELARILFFGFLIPGFLYYLFPDYWLFFMVWLAISLLRLGRMVLIYYHDSLLITNVSLMDVVWTSLFNRTSSRLEYTMIEGVTLEIKGFWQVVFNYGTVNVQGAGGGTYISLKEAVNPRKVEKMIMVNQEKFTAEQEVKDTESLKSLLTSLIRRHAQEQAEQVNN